MLGMHAVSLSNFMILLVVGNCEFSFFAKISWTIRENKKFRGNENFRENEISQKLAHFRMISAF
jgi:hypothetical protein